MKRLWVLGASDPEMERIEELLDRCGETYVYATKDGKRVHPGNAYQMDPIRDPLPWGGTIYIVECDVPSGSGTRLILRDDPRWRHDDPESCGATSDDYLPIIQIDHHRPGDPGYGRPPAEFMDASSIGRVIHILAGVRVLPWDSDNPRYCDDQGHDYAEFWAPHDSATLAEWAEMGRPPSWVIASHVGNEAIDYFIPGQYIYCAAADHCLGAAYRGECPGVDPDDLMQWRVEQRAKFQGRSVDEVLDDVDAARRKLREVPHNPYADLRGQSIPELPEAAAREHIPFLASQTERDGREKVVLQVAGPELVQQFLDGEICPELIDLYGDPARGFAGGYLP